MNKEFDRWNHKKKTTHSRPARPLFREGEVWWCALWANVGDEQDGKGEKFLRPVLVMRKFNRHVFVGLPLSTQVKDKPYYYSFQFKGNQQSIILSQIKWMDGKRLEDKMGEVPPKNCLLSRKQQSSTSLDNGLPKNRLNYSTPPFKGRGCRGKSQFVI